MRRRLRAVIPLLLLLGVPAVSACGAAGSATTVGPGGETAPRRQARVGLKKIGDFDSPVYVSGAPGSPRLLFVVEQPGRVAVLRGGHRLRHPFLDISGLVSFEGERGLLSIAFPPDYARSGRFYAYYTNDEGNIEVDEFHRRSPTRAAPGSRREVIVIPHPVNANHNGGQMQFLGNLLYFGTGDGGSEGDPPKNAQNKNVLLGKLVRIDPRPGPGGRPYTIPPSNPFVGRSGLDEIYSYGLRNPFRFSFDRTHGKPRIAIGDVGGDRFEELDYETVAAARGANFGWNAFEGYHRFQEGAPDPGGTTKPVFAYSHSRNGSCTIIGGYVVHDPRLPSLRGRYVYADYCEGRLRALMPHLRRAGGDHALGPSVASPTSFGEDDRGRIYVTSQQGPVYRLVPR
jgi:glucose/arabinose dehydrogenase